MRSSLGKLVGLALIAGASMAASGCAESKLHLSSEFGEAFRQDLAAQVADPDAVYTRARAPASDGMRAGLAQTHYQQGQVTPPASSSTSTVVATGVSSGR